MAFETARAHNMVPRILTSIVREKPSGLMSGVIAPAMLPNWGFLWVSHWMDRVRGMAYTRAVHVVVDPTKLFQCERHHIVDTSFFCNVHFHRCCLEIGMCGEIPALFGSDLGTFFIDVCKNHTFASGLSKGNGCFFANAAGGLKEQVREDL